MKRRTLTFLLAGCLLLTGCASAPTKPAVTSGSLSVEKVENLPEILFWAWTQPDDSMQ